MAEGMSCACASPHLLGKSWKLFVVSTRCGGSWDLSDRLQRIASWWNYCTSSSLYCSQKVPAFEVLWVGVMILRPFFQKWKVASWNNRRKQSMDINLKQVQIRAVFTKPHTFLAICRTESLQMGLVPLCKIPVLILLKELTNTSVFQALGS